MTKKRNQWRLKPEILLRGEGDQKKLIGPQSLLLRAHAGKGPKMGRGKATGNIQ